LLVKEKIVTLKNVYALEVEKCENLSKELDICNDSISCLRTENASLNDKIEELNTCNVSTSTVERLHSGMEIKVWVKLLYLLTIPFSMFSL
jgi:prefoldin subunit 5